MSGAAAMNAIVPPLAATGLQRFGLFATPLVQGSLPQAEMLNGALRELILAEETRRPPMRVSVAGGWQSDLDFGDWAGPAGRQVLRAMLDVVKRLTKARRGVEVTPSWRLYAWANVIRRGHFNHAHAHPGNFWSAVYYVDDGGCAGRPELGGEIEFFDPRGPAPAMYNPLVATTTPDGEAAGASVKITPAAGSFIVFPAYLTHAVSPYLGDGTRISIAMNFALDEERGRPVAGLT